MSFNSVKFTSVTFVIKKSAAEGKSMNLPPLVSDNGTPIKKVNAVNDLGVWIAQDLSFGLNVQYTRKKTWKAINLVLRTFKTRNQEIMTVLWKSLCLSHITYGTIVMGKIPVGLEHQHEAIQRKFTSLMYFGPEQNYDYQER